MSMLPNNKHTVSEKELDNLLGQAFLNLDFNNTKNQKLMETISTQVLPIRASTIGLLNKSFIAKISIIIIAIITSILIFVFPFNSKPTPLPFNKINNSLDLTSNKLIPQQIPDQSSSLLNSDSAKTSLNVKNKTVNKNISNALNEPAIKTPLRQESMLEQKTIFPADTNYIFPVLTPEEIKITLKQKQKMTNWLFRKSEDKYSLVIPKAGHSIFSSMNDTNAMFYIQNTEVTNFEYRTFLFDLLMNDNKKSFLIAKPNQKMWLNTPGNAKSKMMKDFYFSEKKYNDYPVVNITQEGAELYCEWLSSLSKKGYSKIAARLPYENEWIYAAKVKDSASIYPWHGTAIQNKNGCFLANFCIKKQQEKLKFDLKCVPKNANGYTSAEYTLGDSMMTAYVYAYAPNDNGIYCMAGNVSEMVYANKINNLKNVIIKGGSWNSDFEECKINNHEAFKSDNANSMTGFRPIFRINMSSSFGASNREDTKTGLTTLTSEEIVTALKEKKKMINALVKNNKEDYAYILMGSYIYKKDTFSVQAFNMQTTEVTNLEFRTFLADLLIQNRTSDYLTAKPNQEAWITKFPGSFSEPMRDLYFSHPAYDEYPVVNISRQAAEMYCLWLTTEANKILKENNKPLINDLRIPTDLEWAYAASNKKDQTKYANGNTFLRNSKGLFEMNYMCYSMEECKYDTTLNLYTPKVDKKKYVDDGGFHTLRVRSYAPNSYGLYCMAGNVSEMVNTYNKKNNTYLKKGVKGGSWFSCDYFLEIFADDEYPNEINASPFIGFRPVMTALQTK